MEYEKNINRVIWIITGLMLVLAVILEFRIDKIFIQRYLSCIEGHRDFAVNIALGGFASGVITGVVTRATFVNKKQNIEERINRYLYDVKKYFDGYCHSIAENNYDNLNFYMEKFEDAMTDFTNCIYSNNFKHPKYEKIEKIYCENIIQYSTIIMIYNVRFVIKDGNEKLLFADLSDGILCEAKHKFNEALEKALKNNNIQESSFNDADMLRQMDEIEKRYSIKKKKRG